MKKQMILLVDDNPKLLKLGKVIFESGDYNVITATDGIEALGVLSEYSIDLVVTDILMPNMDGYTLCYTIRNDEKNKDVPIIIYSATYISQSDEAFAISTGADVFIRKPATMGFLLKTAKDLLAMPIKTKRKIEHTLEKAEVTRQYNHKLIEKLEIKNEDLEKAHAELVKSENRFRALIENNFDAITLKDKNGKLFYQSPATERMTGYTAAETMGKNAVDFFHHDDIVQVALRMEAAKANPGTPIYGRNRMKHKNGHYIWVEGTSTNLLDDENVKAVVGNFRDITESVERQQQVDFDHNNLYALINNTYDLMWSVDRDYKLITSNKAFEEITTYMGGKPAVKGDDLLGYAASAEEAAKYKAFYDRAFMGEIFRVNEYTDVPVPFWSELSFYPILNENEVVGTACYSHNTTEQKCLEKQVESERKRLSDLFLQAPSSICILTGPSHVFEMANPIYLQLTGKNNVIGKTVAEVFPEVAGQGFFELLDTVYKTGESYIGNEVLKQIDLDGNGILTDYYLDFVYQPYKNDAGKTVGVFFFANVVTEQVVARKKTEQKEKYFRALVENASDLITLTDETGLLNYLSPALAKLTGCSAADVTGSSLFAFQHPEELEEARRKFNALLQNPGVPVARTSRFRCHDGSYIWVEGTVINLLADESVRGIVGNFRDITERKLAQEHVERSEKYFRALIENGGDAVVILSEAGRPLYVSPSIERVLGYTEEEAIQKDMFSLMHPDDIAETAKVMQDALARPGEPIKGHTGRLMHKDGTWHWYDATVTNMLHDPTIAGIVDNFRDVTERKLAEAKLINANRLYGFISGINQMIVQVQDEQTLFNEVCRIATEIGKFKMVWIGIFDKTNNTINLIESCGIPSEDTPLFTNAHCDAGGPQAHVLSSGEPFICNDVQSELELPGWKEYTRMRGLLSFMVLPIKKFGSVIGTLNIYAAEKSLFDHQEIALLNEATGDISFALNVFEKEKHRKKMEEKVAHSEYQLRNAQAIAHFGSWELDFSTGIAEWSEEACRIYGLDVQDNKHSYNEWLSYIHPDDADYVVNLTKEGADTLTSSAFHHRIIRRDGAVRHIFSQAQFVFKNGIPVGIQGVAHDVTDMKKAEQALAQSEANLRLIMDLIPQSIFAKNYDGKYVFTNKSFAALYGLTPAQLINRAVTETIPVKEEAEQFLKQDRELILTGQSRTIPEHTFTDFEGNVRLFRTAKVPFKVAGSNEKAILGITVDITEQKHIEEERTRMMADIVQRNKNLEQFSYIISHNLRAPVANIIGLADIMQTSALNKDEEEKVLAFLAAAVKNLDNVIHDLNHILSVKNEVSEIKQMVNFAALLAEVKSGISNMISKEHAVITGNFDEAQEILTVKSYLHSIFFNLISNSIKYRQPEVNPVIEISSIQLNDKIRLTFKDNGLGIDLEKKGHHVFGLYKRFHDHAEGKGMGLYMVKTQVETLGGTISVASEINEGTEFTIEFDKK